MKAELNGTSYMVSIERDEVVTFANSWPGNNLDIDATYVMEFSSGNGDLVDLVKYVDGKLCQLDEDEDGPEFAALAEEACEFGARALNLNDVLSIRFNEGIKPGM